MSRVVVLAWVLAGCYQPSYDGLLCGAYGTCPSGYTCNGHDMCVRSGGGGDDEPDAQLGDAAVDVAIDTPPGAFCLGAGSLFTACFATAPTGTLSLTTQIDTSTANSLCDATASTTTACVMASGQITVPGGTSFRVVGPRALVLVSTSTISITGDLIASSSRTNPGAGSVLVPCSPGPVPGNASGGAGGGAGGSFLMMGARGGNGSLPGGTAGPSIAAASVTTLRGGCAGQPGGIGSNPLAAIGGPGGGVVYLIAATSITIAGTLSAGGAGGEGGRSRGGGGGGGSGGMIGFASPAVTVSGRVLAGGGGGGEGGDISPGNSGLDAILQSAPAQGGTAGSSFAGDGGAGGFAPAAAQNGQGGSGSSGGGGGGAPGLVKVFPAGALSVSGSGMVSPPAI